MIGSFLNGAFLSDPYEPRVFNFRRPWLSRVQGGEQTPAKSKMAGHYFILFILLPCCRTLGELFWFLIHITSADYCLEKLSSSGYTFLVALAVVSCIVLGFFGQVLYGEGGCFFLEW